MLPVLTEQIKTEPQPNVKKTLLQLIPIYMNRGIDL